MMNYLRRLAERARDFFDVVSLRANYNRLQNEAEMQRYRIDALEAKLRYVNQQYDIVRQEALQAEQIITGVQHHLRSFPNDTSRVVKHMLSGR